MGGSQRGACRGPRWLREEAGSRVAWDKTVNLGSKEEAGTTNILPVSSLIYAGAGKKQWVCVCLFRDAQGHPEDEGLALVSSRVLAKVQIASRSPVREGGFLHSGSATGGSGQDGREWHREARRKGGGGKAHLLRTQEGVAVT